MSDQPSDLTREPVGPDARGGPAAAAPAASSAPRPRSRTRRVLRAIAWSLAFVVVLVVALGAGAWWWIGSDGSLAFLLDRASRYMPAGQTLQSREVAGSVRAGGRIGFLRWQSDTLAVEVHDARIGWQWRPLLERKVRLGEVHAAQLLIEPRGAQPEKKDEPIKPLEPIVLPVEVELPFRIDDLRWAGPPALQATGLAGSYRYVDGHHRLAVDQVAIAQGRYQAKIDLQGAAPMAIDAQLSGQVLAPLAEGRSLEVGAQAKVQGTLAGDDARLAISAELAPTTPDADAQMQAKLDARIAPWARQPVIEAHADLRNIDAASLWPEAPVTLLSGQVDVEPEGGSAASGASLADTTWRIEADLRNARPGPWDRQRVPVESVAAQARFDGTRWQIEQAQLRAGGGRIEAEGAWSPAPDPWTITANVRGVRPGELHTALAGAPVSGRLRADQKGETLAFDLALQSEGGIGSKAIEGLRLERAVAVGQWQLNTQVLDLRNLRIEAARALIEAKGQARVAEQAGSGEIRLSIPGANAQAQGRVAPASGNGQLALRIDDAATLQRWVEALPGAQKAFAGISTQGAARLDAQWQGGWQAIQRRLERIDQPVGRGAAEPSLTATLVAPRFELRLPAAPAAAATNAAGAAGASGSASGSAASAAPNTLAFRDLRAELSGSLPSARLNLTGELNTGTRKIRLDTRANGGLDRPGQWRAALDALSLQAEDSLRPGAWRLELGQAFSAVVRTGGDRLEVEASASSATLRGPVPGTVRLDWEPLRFSQRGAAADRSFRLQTRGRMQGLPLAWVKALGNDPLGEVGISGDLLFAGDWDIDAADALRARARLVRQSGDIRVQAGEAALVTRIRTTGTGTAREREMNAAAEGTSTPAGLREAELRIDAENERVSASLAWDSARAGQIRAEADTRVQRRADGWQWAPDAPLGGKVSARLPNLGVWSILAPPGWRVAGTLEADATLSGSRNDPRWNGQLSADQLALRALVEGLDLRDGRLRAQLQGNRLQLTEFSLKGGAGSSTRIPGQSGNLSTGASEAASDGGSITASGNMSWGAASPNASGIRMQLDARLQRLRLLVRSDRQITLSGSLQTRLESGQISVRGDLKTDRGVIILPEESAPSLGTDVVVRSAARAQEAAEAARKQAATEDARVQQAQTAKPPDIQISFDLGNDFAVQGRGITTRLEGKLDIRATGAGAPPRLTGEVRTVKGQYRAYGQQLDVETGLARFNGPFDNPSLDILAIRPNITQRAGVQITGTAQSPRVRLYSEPRLSDAETLSWVVLGRASASSGGESLLLQQAALALLGGLGKGGSGGGLASRFGLDEIGFKGPGSGGDLRESALTVGKRISKDFYVTYQRSLSGALGSLFIFYDLTRRLTLRGQAGQQSAIDLIYTLQYE